MKYENFNEVQSICKSIENNTRKLEYLNSDNISIKLLDGSFSVMTIGAWPSCEHECKEYAISFVGRLKTYYEFMIKNLHSKLELL